MSRAAFTVKAFAIYLFVVGATLILAPNLLLRASFLPVTSEVWIRVVGVLAFNIGVYYWYAAKSEAKAVLIASVCARTFVFVAFVAFAVLRLTPPALVVFGVVDLAGAAWTWSALRAGQRAG
jgi:hypothetical protein